MNQKNSNRNFSTAASNTSWRQSAPLIAGAALAVFGLSRRSTPGFLLAAAGGALAFTGWRINFPRQDEFLARGSVLINCSSEAAYVRYRKLEELPTFMHHLKSVTKTGERQYRWVALGPLGIPIQWDAEIVDERENEFLSWRSLPGSELTAAGSVRFEKAPADRGTIVTAITHFDHPAGNLGYAVAKLFGKDPSFLIQQDLRRFKSLIETGEIATTEGQTHGPRSLKGTAAKLADPDRPLARGPQATEILKEQRRTA
ncbi:MAG TPA: SRPBCC family protein [Candidatus Sulfotelmatobacter sp.]|nr:SRPBCC family protein [Candidatus Sulfotelmatobacter sp.]